MNGNKTTIFSSSKLLLYILPPLSHIWLQKSPFHLLLREVLVQHTPPTSTTAAIVMPMAMDMSMYWSYFLRWLHAPKSDLNYAYQKRTIVQTLKKSYRTFLFSQTYCCFVMSYLNWYRYSHDLFIQTKKGTHAKHVKVRFTAVISIRRRFRNQNPFLIPNHCPLSLPLPPYSCFYFKSPRDPDSISRLTNSGSQNCDIIRHA